MILNSLQVFTISFTSSIILNCDRMSHAYHVDYGYFEDISKINVKAELRFKKLSDNSA